MNAFEKIIGYSSETREFMQIADTLKNRAYYDKLGVSPLKGLLLHGGSGRRQNTEEIRLIRKDCIIRSAVL